MIALLNWAFIASADDKSNSKSETIEVSVDSDNGDITKKVIVNGKELSAEELVEFEASGKMKVIHIDSDKANSVGHKMMFVNSDSEHDADIDFEVIMEKVDDLKGLHKDNSITQEWITEDGKNIKIVKKGLFSVDDNSASLGFVANIEDDGWHLSKVMDESGAKDVGILEGDIVTSIAGMNLTKDPDSERLEVHSLPKFEDGEIVKVELKRDGQPISFDVPARMLDKSSLTVDLLSKGGEHFEWIEKFEAGGEFSSNVKVMLFDGKDGQFKLNEEDIHMVFPDKIGKMNFFISDGQSTSKLLGKHHEMSSLSDGLGKYFNTKGGVLVLHVDDTNVFNLKDGDVIKTINNNKVDSPKDVVKQLINADDQEKIKMQVVRNKKSKTLKYEK